MSNVSYTDSNPLSKNSVKLVVLGEIVGKYESNITLGLVVKTRIYLRYYLDFINYK